MHATGFEWWTKSHLSMKRTGLILIGTYARVFFSWMIIVGSVASIIIGSWIFFWRNIGYGIHYRPLVTTVVVIMVMNQDPVILKSKSLTLKSSDLNPIVIRVGLEPCEVLTTRIKIKSHAPIQPIERSRQEWLIFWNTLENMQRLLVPAKCNLIQALFVGEGSKISRCTV
jgi:hypothetical protein